MRSPALASPTVETKLGWGGETSASSHADGQDKTMSSVLSHLWEGLWSNRATACPLCGQAMHLRDGAGCCSECGTVLR
jgi:hypothetical protein